MLHRPTVDKIMHELHINEYIVKHYLANFWTIVGYNEPHVLLLVTQGAQKKISSTPPPRIKAIIARMVHTVEAEVTRVDSSLLAAGRSTTSSVFKPNLLALPNKNLRRRDAFSQDILNDLSSSTVLFEFSRITSLRYSSLYLNSLTNHKFFCHL